MDGEGRGDRTTTRCSSDGGGRKLGRTGRQRRFPAPLFDSLHRDEEDDMAETFPQRDLLYGLPNGGDSAASLSYRAAMA